MVSRIAHTTIDTRNAYELSLFWADVLGWVENPADPNLPEHAECMIFAPDGSARLLFIDVPEHKQVKNRLHLDVQAVGSSRDEEVERLLALGATLFEDHRKPDGTGWATLADPEGNEFCVLRTDWAPTPFEPQA
jgi:predicted enzyme related to lactoylglutathione lyase